MTKTAKILINLRVSPEERDELKATGELAGRSLPNEIMYRLRQYQAGEPGDDARALGDLTALIARRVGQALNTLHGEPWETMASDKELADANKAWSTGVAANTHYALGLVLHELGAMAGTSDRKVTDFATWDIVKRMTTPRPGDDTPEGRILARVGKVLQYKQESKNE